VTDLFCFTQVEFPWQLGPADGRDLVRGPGDPEGPPSHVIVLATLGAPERRRIATRRRRDAHPHPTPTPVPTTRVTVIDAGRPPADEAAARAWLAAAGEDELRADLTVLNRALHAFRLATADPYVAPAGRAQTLVARVGFGAGEEVADGVWTAARELPPPDRGRRLRARPPRGVLEPQSRLAALLGGRAAPLASEELTLRARLDLDHGRPREAALQLLVALDAALAELGGGRHADELRNRLDELRGRRDAVAAAAQTALTGPLSDDQLAEVASTVGRIEAALRAHAAAGA
jgi:hypothetical protein